jgi:hypothetical protein
MLPNGIFMLEEPLRKCLVDHCHLTRVCGIPLRDAAPHEYGRSDDVEVARRYSLKGSRVILRRSRLGMSLYVDAIVPAIAALR